MLLQAVALPQQDQGGDPSAHFLGPEQAPRLQVPSIRCNIAQLLRPNDTVTHSNIFKVAFPDDQSSIVHAGFFSRTHIRQRANTWAAFPVLWTSLLALMLLISDGIVATVFVHGMPGPLKPDQALHQALPPPAPPAAKSVCRVGAVQAAVELCWLTCRPGSSSSLPPPPSPPPTCE